ncbi:FBXW7 [Symbiodinium sp. CCMP2592]|nr:FBXW7 [Symbiodinium sp. CCMP2592]
MWEVIQMGFQQVEDILDSINLGHYRDYFIAKGMFYGAKMRALSRKFLDLHMPAITDPDEKDQLLEVCATACKDENIRLFPYRYGDPDKLLHACHEGRRFLTEKYTQGWFCDISLISYPLMVDAYNKSHMLAEEDKQSIRAYDSWVFGADSAGRLYLFPQSDSKVPPCVRCPRLHSISVLDAAVDWKAMRSVSVGMEGIMNFYNLEKDAVEHSLHVAAACSLSASKDFWSALDADFELGNMAAGLSSGHLQLVDLELAKPVCMIPSHAAMVRNVKANWTTNEVASCSYDGFINLVDARTTKTVRRLKGEGQWDAMDVCFDKQIALAASKFEPATTLWDLRSGQVVREYDLPGHRPNCINVDWKTMTACTGADDGKVMFWDLETGEVSQTIDCEHFLTQSLDICWSRGLLLTGSFDYQFKLWDVKSGTLLKRFIEPTRCLTRVFLQ